MKQLNILITIAVLGLIAGACADRLSLGSGPEPEGVVVDPATGRPDAADSSDGIADRDEGRAVYAPARLPNGDSDGGDPASPTTAVPQPVVSTVGPSTAPSTAPTVTDPPTTPPTSEASTTTEPPTTTTEPPTTTTQPTTTTTQSTTITQPTTTAVPVSSLLVTLIRFQVIGDCDGIEGVGEWAFRAKLFDHRNAELLATSAGDQSLSDGEYVNRIAEARFSVPAEEGRSFRVQLTAEEWDTDLFTGAFMDSRMSRFTVEYVHTYRSGIWTNLNHSSTGLGGTYPNAVQLPIGSGSCSAELHYVVDVA